MDATSSSIELGPTIAAARPQASSPALVLVGALVLAIVTIGAGVVDAMRIVAQTGNPTLAPVAAAAPVPPVRGGASGEASSTIMPLSFGSLTVSSVDVTRSGSVVDLLLGVTIANTSSSVRRVDPRSFALLVSGRTGIRSRHPAGATGTSTSLQPGQAVDISLRFDARSGATGYALRYDTRDDIGRTMPLAVDAARTVSHTH